jgi:hypothetical protein
LRRSLATDPEQRFPDAGVMQAEWRRLMRAAEQHKVIEDEAAANGEAQAVRQSWWRRVIGR